MNKYNRTNSKKNEKKMSIFLLLLSRSCFLWILYTLKVNIISVYLYLWVWCVFPFNCVAFEQMKLKQCPGVNNNMSEKCFFLNCNLFSVTPSLPSICWKQIFAIIQLVEQARKKSVMQHPEKSHCILYAKNDSKQIFVINVAANDQKHILFRN